MTPVDDLAKSVEQWTAPTPCTEWNVRELLTHLVSGNVVFARLLRGEVVPAGWDGALGRCPSPCSGRYQPFLGALFGALDPE